ncbi:uncharacterized protein LOC142784990 [Rhipicephalus microplus]|uniref:uncharacterized protein LOC142784990 n=1 Tax=Rhipicephalus microplus TaxID=6941 RepID=UPI003F6C0DA6
MVRSSDTEACAATWQRYLELKHEVQALVLAKIAEYNKKLFQSLRVEGKNAAQKFWQYVQTLDRRQQNSPQLRDADTNQPVAHVRQHLTRYISGLFGSMGNDGDRDASAAATLHPALGERQEEGEPRWAGSSVTVIRALARMSTRTATGPDEVPAHLVKCLRPQAREKLADQLSSILSGAEIPKDWRQGRITLILKQGGAADPLQSYRPITVTSVMYRMFADDILLMAEITKEMQALLDICQDEITRLGLCFNVKKIALLRLVGECTKESVVTLGDAEVSSCTEYRYLGVKLSAPTDMYSLHEAKTREAGLRAQSILWRRCF